MKKDKLIEWLEGEILTLDIIIAQSNNLISHYISNIKKLLEMLKESE